MKLSKDEIQQALRIKKAIQHYLDQTKGVNLRSTDVFPYLVRRGLFEQDSKNGLYFRRFLKKLFLNEMLHLIPQCKHVPGINGEIFGEWYFNSFNSKKEVPLNPNESAFEVPEKGEAMDSKAAEEIIFNLIQGKHPETGQTLNFSKDSALILVQKSLKIIAAAKKETTVEQKLDSNPLSSKDEKVPSSIDAQREIYEKAYFPWTPEDDEKLEILFCEGKSQKELSLIFKRNPGAISSRIKKLELKEKYDR